MIVVLIEYNRDNREREKGRRQKKESHHKERTNLLPVYLIGNKAILPFGNMPEYTIRNLAAAVLPSIQNIKILKEGVFKDFK